MSDRPLPGILERIKAAKLAEIESLLEETGLERLAARAAEANCSDPPRNFFQALGDATRGPLRLIAEIKKASPSKGVIREAFNPVEIAHSYSRGGAAALSCLTDRQYFQGHLDDLAEARAAGADAILLIARMLPREAFERLLDLARRLGMAALCEAHDEEDLERILAAGARIVGINNRDLDTFEVDLATTGRLAKKIPGGTVLVAESGIFGPAEMRRMHDAGASAVLVGESLMRQDDVEAATRALLDW